MFKILKTSKISRARLTRLTTPHGTIDGPFFMPIATRGVVKHLAASELDALGASILLSNTYHLLLKPGPILLKKVGGLHPFMGWKKPILTDSGGFQVFSLTHHRRVTDSGVRFRDPASGTPVFLTPVRALRMQERIGADIMMALDECVGYPASRSAIESAVDRTTAWATITRRAFRRRQNGPLLFAIVQGGTFPELRERSCRELTALDFDGYAIGGLAVGEERDMMFKMIRQVAPFLPEHKPRYLMGVGRPEEMLGAVKLGVDMFDCVIPTREARHGRLYTWAHPEESPAVRLSHFGSNRSAYRTLNIRRAKFAHAFHPIDPKCNCPCCRSTTLAYLRHLFAVHEPLGQRLATLHNVRFYLEYLEMIRLAIRRKIL